MTHTPAELRNIVEEVKSSTNGLISTIQVYQQYQKVALGTTHITKAKEAIRQLNALLDEVERYRKTLEFTDAIVMASVSNPTIMIQAPHNYEALQEAHKKICAALQQDLMGEKK